ncbi:MAG: hypothetical protein V8K32_10735 [Candidatus Electrothrix gigas]
MPTTLTLQIPDRIYRPLQKKAVQRGKTLDQIIIEWLGNAVTALCNYIAYYNPSFI